MQLVFADVLKKNKYCLEMVQAYFTAMKAMNIGKQSILFMEKAAELGNLVLTNKTYQATRFVRSLLRGLTAGLRNLPTLYAVYGDDTVKIDNGHDTRSGESNSSFLEKLMKSENLFFTIGLCQLLEIYAEASLESQYASHFPIQVSHF